MGKMRLSSGWKRKEVMDGIERDEELRDQMRMVGTREKRKNDPPLVVQNLTVRYDMQMVNVCDQKLT